MAAALAAGPTFCERFSCRSRTLARLSHPNTVTIHGHRQCRRAVLHAMEYLPNGTLKERIAAGLSPEQGLAYVRQIASAGYAMPGGAPDEAGHPVPRDGTGVGLIKSLTSAQSPPAAPLGPAVARTSAGRPWRFMNPSGQRPLPTAADAPGKPGWGTGSDRPATWRCQVREHRVPSARKGWRLYIAVHQPLGMGITRPKRSGGHTPSLLRAQPAAIRSLSVPLGRYSIAM